MELNLLNIVTYIENKLNAALRQEINDNGNTVLDNDRETYAFKLFLDAGNYEAYDYIKPGMNITDEGFESINPTNKFCNYINGIITVTESNVQGVESPILTFSTMLELLIPLREINENSTSMELVGSIRKVIDNALSKNEYAAFDNYNMGMAYSLAGTGSRDIKSRIGDSLSLYVYIAFSFVANGVNSTEIKAYVMINNNYVEIPALRLGYARVSNQEKDVSSESTNGSAGAITSDTAFSFNFDKPVQKTDIDDLFREYLLLGRNEIYTVKIVEPKSDGTSLTYEKQMVINEVTRNTDTTLNASETVTMIEALV